MDRKEVKVNESNNPIKRNKAEMNITNLLRSKIPDGNIEIVETAPRLFQASCTIDGLEIQAQGFSKRIAKKRLFLFLMMLMPKVLQTLDVSEWLGDGAGFAPDATYGTTESQRGQKRGPGLYENEIPCDSGILWHSVRTNCSHLMFKCMVYHFNLIYMRQIESLQIICSTI